MKATIKLQKEINKIATLQNVTGEIFIDVKTTVTSLLELDAISDQILSEIVTPKDFCIHENKLSKNGLVIYIHFTK